MYRDMILNFYENWDARNALKIIEELGYTVERWGWFSVVVNCRPWDLEEIDKALAENGIRRER